MQRANPEQDPIIEIQGNTQDKLAKLTTQTAGDRTCIVELRSLCQEERACRVGNIAMAVAERFANDDPSEVSLRIERLYASLSINTEPHDETLLLDVVSIDEILTEVIDKLPAVTSPDILENSRQAFEDARNHGLNPTKRQGNPFALPQNQTTVNTVSV